MRTLTSSSSGGECRNPSLGLAIKAKCRNPSFGLATKAKGVARLRAKRKEARESRQRHCNSANQEEGSPRVKAKALQECGPRKSPGIKARGSPGVTSHTPGIVRKCEGV